MFKKMSLCAIALFVTLGSANAGNGKYKSLYKVTITNLTAGQPLSPALIAIHSPRYRLVKIGEKATNGLGSLARGGVTSILNHELKYEKKVVRTKIGTGALLPGKSESLIVEANNPHFKISLVSMLARTNDAISVLNSASLNLKKGQRSYHFTEAYDAGVELNTESCADIPAPPCGSHNVGQSEHSFIRPHAGIQLIGDLDAKRDVFASKVSRVIIERIQ